MGALRGIVLVFVCVLIFISFLLLGTFATLNSSLDYETVKPQIKPLIESSINLTQIYDYEDILNNSCLNESEFFYNDSNYTFVIPCEVIANGTEAIFDYQVDLLIKENYYKNEFMVIKNIDFRSVYDQSRITILSLYGDKIMVYC